MTRDSASFLVVSALAGAFAVLAYAIAPHVAALILIID
jgi:hypothetical protein